MPHPVIVLLAALLLLGFIARRVLPARTVVQHLEVRDASDLAHMQACIRLDTHAGVPTPHCEVTGSRAMICIDRVQHQRAPILARRPPVKRSRCALV